MNFIREPSFAGRPVVDYYHKKPLPEDFSKIALQALNFYWYDSDSRQFPDGVEPTSALSWLANKPFADKIDCLVVGMLTGTWDELSAVRDDLARTLEAGGFPALKHLFFGNIDEGECQNSFLNFGDVLGLLSLLPNLETLKIRDGAGFGTAPERHDNLRSLVLETGGPPPASVLTCMWPRLETLEIWTGHPDFGGASAQQISIFRPLLSGLNTPSLKHLAIKNCAFSDELAMALTNSPLLQQLEILDLTWSTLTDRGADALLREQKQLAHLKQLDVRYNFLSRESAQALSDLPIPVKTDGQRELNEWQHLPFVPVGE